MGKKIDRDGPSTLCAVLFPPALPSGEGGLQQDRFVLASGWALASQRLMLRQTGMTFMRHWL